MLRGCLQTKVTTEWYLLFPTITSSGLRPTKRKHSETCRLRRQFNAWRRRRVLRRQRGAKSTFSPIAISTTTAYAITRPKQPTWRPPDSANTSVSSVGKFGTVTESEKNRSLKSRALWPERAENRVSTAGAEQCEGWNGRSESAPSCELTALMIHRATVANLPHVSRFFF